MEGKRYSLIVGARSDAEIFATLEMSSSKRAYIIDALESYIDGSSRPVDAFDASTEEKYRQLVEYVMRNYPQEYEENRERTYVYTLSNSAQSEILNKLESQRNKTKYVKMALLTKMGFVDANGNRFVIRGLNVDNDGGMIVRTKTEHRREQVAMANKKRMMAYKNISVYLPNEEYNELGKYLEKTGQTFSEFATQAIMDAFKRDARMV